MVTFGFVQTMYSVPEEDDSGKGSVLKVCVELFASPSVLDRDVVIRVDDISGSATGTEHM